MVEAENKQQCSALHKFYAAARVFTIHQEEMGSKNDEERGLM
ncbi:hypothetical protein [Nostoc sp.]